MSRSGLIWAVGGESLCAPADTMPAYWGALGAGANGIWVGVQLTADGTLICCGQPTLEATTGEPRPVGDLEAAEIRRLDAGRMFRSTELDKYNQPGAVGDDTPWIEHNRGDALYHPQFWEMLLSFSTRASLLVRLMSPRRDSPERRQILVDETMKHLGRFGLERTAIIAGDEKILGLVRKQAPEARLALVSEDTKRAADWVSIARKLRASYLIVRAENLIKRRRKGLTIDPALPKSLGRSGLRVIITSDEMPFALTPDYFTLLDSQPWVAGFACRAVRETLAMRHPPRLIVADDFRGREVNRTLWTVGYSKENRNTEIRHDDGLTIEIQAGGEYSGAAALTSYSIRGQFDARVAFRVANPTQGTTFELAAIQVDPGYHNMDNRKIDRRNANLTFDVHGAPPYASSERDEDDGFRIGWNNGPALMRIVETENGAEVQSVNAYNKYSRDVGEASKENPTGQLRLVRGGEVFNAYYTDKHNRQWVLSGSVPAPTLCRDVFLRLGAKHWPKGGRVPPPNRIDFSSFRLYQWDGRGPDSSE